MKAAVERISAIIRDGVCRVCRLPFPQHVAKPGAAHNFDNDPSLVAEAVVAALLASGGAGGKG
ncbi:MAG: hypothetical protein ACRENJ_03860 [Candidatus Eiseniibacteriota bacterium]